MFRIDHKTLSDLTHSLQLEWLETDGLGGFASSSVVGANTRRYHGLLVAATTPPVGRRVLVAKIEDRVHGDGDLCAMSCNIYNDAVHPDGHQCQQEFRLDPWPVYVWEEHGVRLQKSIFMPHKRGITVIRYDLLAASQPVWLAARPLIAGRDMHHLMRSNNELQAQVGFTADTTTIQPYDGPSRTMLYYPQGDFRADGLWYYNFRYFRELESGLDYLEDLYSPGEIVWLMRPGETRWLVLGRETPADFDGEVFMAQERERREKLLNSFGPDRVAGRLALAADQFIVDRNVGGEDSKTIIAGYPWFGDWGRDTMIALFGLTLTTRRYADCRAMLKTFVASMRNGLVPNLFAEGSGDAWYNTVDATLWLFIAIHKYVELTEDWEFITEVWPALERSLEAHIAGTDYSIHMTEDGLLSAGDPTTQLTWMDAKVEEWVVTPRHGKAVEINAMWYNALKIGEFFAEKVGSEEAKSRYGKLAAQTEIGFEQFWSEELGFCYDVIRPEGADCDLRPNQLIISALPFAPLTPERRRSLLQKCSEYLLTPYGMRTLGPFCVGYCPAYGGDRLARDAAYHQGTAWPWLLGPYLTTYFEVMGVNEETRRHVRALLQPLVDHLDDAGLGSISEIFDADEPFAPHGCIAQAWSVGEVLRCWVQYRLGELDA
ncbi:MAG: amylo-alpha-1,6-glucosidase [Armatimonadota bacterium]